MKKKLIRLIKNKFNCGEREAILWLLEKRTFFNDMSIFEYATINDENYKIVLSLLQK